MNLKQIRESLPAHCRILAVSKLQSIDQIRELAKEGQIDFGENYLQEAMEKQEQLRSLNLNWHFIGRVQSKKIKDLVGTFELLHSIETVDHLKKVGERALQKGLQQAVLLQVNLSREESKGGFSRPLLLDNWNDLTQIQGIKISGLMTMPPLENDTEMNRPYFQQLRKLRDELRKTTPSVQELSMGTSHDYKVAAEEGATWVRLGTILFGPRPTR